MQKFNRVFVLVIDSLGIGEMPDSEKFGDEATIIIKDKQAPQQAEVSFSSSTIEIGENTTATVKHKDMESGVNIENCKYIFSTNNVKLLTTDIKWNNATYFNTSTQTSSDATTSTNKITLNSTTEGNYYLHILTEDKAGNKTTMVSASTVTIAQANNAQ